jgi:peptidoglycan/xylan/chitin deacetylase (PgdA/CDA1 family)
MVKNVTDTVVLTLHGIQSNSLPNDVKNDPAAQRYTIDVSLFNSILKIVGNMNCITLRDLMQQQSGIALTFDDGLITDYQIVFKKLQENNLRATYFVTVNNIGKQGYCTKEQLVEMYQYGMEIGSHGWTHTYLTTKTHKEVVKEIVDSKKWLESELGIKVDSYAPVGGHYKEWMKNLAFEASYNVFASMVPGKNRAGRQSLLVKRNHIQSHYNKHDVEDIVFQNRFKSIVNGVKYQSLRTLKQVLGMKRYDRWKIKIMRN